MMHVGTGKFYYSSEKREHSLRILKSVSRPKKERKAFQFARMFPLFRVILKFCSTNRLFP